MKINILDAGITSRAGHHYDYGLKLLKHYAQAGHDVHVYGFEGLEAEAAADFEEFGQLTRLFRKHPYHDADEYDWYAGELARFRSESTHIAEDLRAVAPADVWIWPTIRPAEIEACTRHRVGVPMVGCVYWDPGFESGSIEAQLWRDVLMSAKAAGLRLTLASVEAELRHRFMPILPNGRFAVVPQPVDGPPVAQPKTALKRIGFFGHQREEKGHALMEPLLSRLIEDGYALTFQDSAKEVALPDLPGVDRLLYAKDLAVPIAACDLVVLPYDVQKYRARGSGILMECLALGIPVTAPFGTLPGRTIELAGTGPLFIGSRVDPIYHAIKSAERNYAAFAAKAHSHAKVFCKRNGVGRFASALLAAARSY